MRNLKRVFNLLAVVIAIAISANIVMAQKVTPEMLNKLRAPASQEAKNYTKEATRLFFLQDYQQALTASEKAIELAPFYVLAHRRYYDSQLAISSNPQLYSDQLRKKMAAEPDNPLYPLLLAYIFPNINDDERKAFYNSVTEMAPDWAWGQYAAGVMELFYKNDRTRAAAAFRKAAELEPDNPTLHFENGSRLYGWKQYDEAIKEFRKVIELTEDSYNSRFNLWRLKLLTASDRAEMEKQIRNEADLVMANMKPDAENLNIMANAYEELLKDSDRANQIRTEVRKQFPDFNYYTYSIIPGIGLNGVPYKYYFLGQRGLLIKRYYEILQLKNSQKNKEAIDNAERFIKESREDDIKTLLLEFLFKAYQYERNGAEMERIVKALCDLDKSYLVLYDTIALELLTNNGDKERALQFAERVVAATEQFVPYKADGALKIAVEIQQEQYQQNRRRYLSTLGRAYFALGKYPEAEQTLRRSIKISETGENSLYLGLALMKQHKNSEAAALFATAITYHESYEKEAREAMTELAVIDSSIKPEALIERANAGKRDKMRADIVKSFIDEPSKDFELTGFDGKKYKLSELRGKTVLINFWATWCGPCRAEYPHLVELYNRYKDRGFLLLSLSIDEDKDQAREYFQQSKASFPGIMAENAQELYEVNSIPANFFIDPNGHLRYKLIGFNPSEDDEKLSIIVEELLKK